MRQPSIAFKDMDDYALVAAFRDLPKSHEAIRAWFNVGLQCEQWAPRVAFAKEEEIRWALVETRFTDSLLEAGVELKDVELLRRYFAIADESDSHVEHIHKKLKELAMQQDHELPLPNIASPQQRDPGSQMLYIGSLHMGDSYKAGQAGAMGPGATASQINFQQIWLQHSGKIDIESLAEELATLRAVMKKESNDAAKDVAVGEVAAAEQAAKENDGPRTLEHLKKAGTWAFDVSTKIGVGVATAALKTALGL
jgi:hypothetical protein